MNEELLNIEKIKDYILKRKIIWTKHCLNRINQRDILISDIKKAMNNGKIIEYYYEDYPYPSCLVMGKSKDNRIIHIVCGMSGDLLYMITAYYPEIDKWEKNMKNRREENNELL